MKSFFKKLVADNTGVSSKRVIALISFFMIVIVTIVNLLTGKTISQFIFDGLMWIVLGGMGFIATEKFADTFSAVKSPKQTTEEIKEGGE